MKKKRDVIIQVVIDKENKRKLTALADKEELSLSSLLRNHIIKLLK